MASQQGHQFDHLRQDGVRRLLRQGQRKLSRGFWGSLDDRNQGPTPLDFCDQGTHRVPMTVLFAPSVVISVHYLIVGYHFNTLVSMPTFTLTNVNGGKRGVKTRLKIQSQKAAQAKELN